MSSLHEDLAKLGHVVWRDTDITGGQEWWSEICQQITVCDVFVFAFSGNSARSRYCLAELDYALALGRAILPVDVAPVAPELAPPALRSLQHVSYAERTPESALTLARALGTLNIPLRDVAVSIPPPQAPLSDLAGVRDEIMSSDLSEEQQLDIVARLKRDFGAGEDVVVELVRVFRSRQGLPAAIIEELDGLLEKARVAAESGVTNRLLVKALLSHIKRGRLTPILGSGLTEKLTGSRKQLARDWAQTFEFPMSVHLREGLPEVAQYIKVMAGDVALRDSYRDYLEAALHDALEGKEVEAAESMNLDAMFVDAWNARATIGVDPHTMLARQPCPVYVTAHPGQLLEHALIREGKRPRSDICRWRPESEDWPISPFDVGLPDAYVPSASEPLVFHAFGRLDVPDSLVLTEDDYFDFLVSVTEDRTKIPMCVRRSLADSALLILGLQLDDWEFRILWRALVHQEGSGRLSRYKNVAAQIDLAGSVVSPVGAREYLNDYFGKVSVPSLDIFWGSVEDFVTALEVESTSDQ